MQTYSNTSFKTCNSMPILLDKCNSWDIKQFRSSITCITELRQKSPSLCSTVEPKFLFHQYNCKQPFQLSQVYNTHPKVTCVTADVLYLWLLYWRQLSQLPFHPIKHTFSQINLVLSIIYCLKAYIARILMQLMFVESPKPKRIAIKNCQLLSFLPTIKL